jgi:hypothetical protein
MQWPVVVQGREVEEEKSVMAVRLDRRVAALESAAIAR